MQLRRNRLLEQLLDLPQAILECGVVDAGGFGGAGDLLDSLRQLRDALRHRGLIARDFFGALCRLEGHRTVLGVTHLLASGRAGRRVLTPGALLREVTCAIAQLALRRGYRVRGSRHRARRGARFGAQLLHARQPQGDFAAASPVRLGRVVPRFDVQSQRVARQQIAMLGIDAALDDRAIADPTDVE